jgi:uncharacterized repeat protein (TIGR03803 family)
MLLVGCGGLQPVGVTQGPVPQGQMPENPSRVTGVRQSPRSVRHASVTETVLHSFRGKPYDGAQPESDLTYFKGTLYGTTGWGGVSQCNVPGQGLGCGTVYSITPSGTETVLHSFTGGLDGARPGGLIVRNGTLYGTTSLRGGGCRHDQRDGCGTVFSMTPSGHETVLYAFTGSPDGSGPGGLLNVNGTLYGTTGAGGVYNNSGTFFSITPGGKEKVLYSFGNGNDGVGPGGLIDVRGTLYGVTGSGGSYCPSYHGCGTVFSITPGGKEKVLYSFGSLVEPTGLVNVSGTLYGTTYLGGAYGHGTVFSITPAGTEKVLYSFGGGNDGADPAAALLNVNGTLYGTTVAGGAYGYGGTVFSITLSGHETVLYSFTGGKDGGSPASPLSYVNGTFYGTTFYGGTYGVGTVYSITP